MPPPYYIEETGIELSTQYVTGREVLVPTQWVWRAMCGSDMSQVTVEMLQEQARARLEAEQDGGGEGKIIIDSPRRGTTGMNLVIVTNASVPAAALEAIQTAEQYIESQFGDPITVRLTVNFANLGSGVIGSAGSGSIQVGYPTARASLVAGMDGDDTIQMALPTGSTIGVRYNSLSTTVTNENRVFFNRANYRATVGSLSSSSDANLTFNSTFNFDYDPSNGVSGTDFQSVFIHEVGHSLGFTSGSDFRNSDIETLDLYRFPRNDSVQGVNNDYDPDTIEEFTARPRFSDLDTASSQDNQEAPANSDLIFVEYPMADGRPNQSSHFSEGFNGIMDPTLGSGQTFFPNFYRESDLTMFDAIGYDVPPSAPVGFGPISPLDGATQVSLKGALEWEQAVGAVQYTVRIDDDPSFNSPEVEQATTFTSFDLNDSGLAPQTLYFWTVIAENGIGSSTISPAVSSFTTAEAPPEPFGLTAPANFATDVSLTPTLDWEESTNASQYRVQVSVSTLFLNNPVDVVIPATSSEYTVRAGILETDTLYSWRVTAINSAEELLSTPTLLRFTTVAVSNVCTADFDADEDVDLDDFSIFASQFGSSGAGLTADIDGDSDVDLDDFSIFASQFGNTPTECIQ